METKENKQIESPLNDINTCCKTHANQFVKLIFLQYSYGSPKKRYGINMIAIGDCGIRKISY